MGTDETPEAMPPAAKGWALGTQVRKCSEPSFLGYVTFADGLRP